MAVVVICGSNRGIGLGLCRLYHASGDDVIALCRKSSSELDALGIRVIEGVDTAEDGVGALLASKLSDCDHIDTLINVSGIFRREALDSMDFHSMQQQFDVNALGPLRVSLALLDKLGSGSKVAMITSRMGSIADNTSGGRYGYRMSKAALNAGCKSLAFDLQPRGISVAILHPGHVATDMTDHNPSAISVEESCLGLCERIDALNLETSGTFYHANGDLLPW